MTTRRSSATAPPSQADSYAGTQQQERLLRLGAFLLMVGMLVFPLVPSPLLGMDWRRVVAPALALLRTPLPPDPIDLWLVVLLPRPLGQWLNWGLAAFLAFVVVTLIMHLGAIYAQRTRPLHQPRSYLRVTIPASAPTKPVDAVTLLKSLHGMVPASNPLQPAPAPLMLCWTARPERPIQQALSLAGPDSLVMSLQKRMQGITSGTKVIAIDDPLLAELQPGRWLCGAEARTVAGDALPIAVVGTAQTLLSGLLPTLAPQAGVYVASVRLIVEPIPDRLWRLDVLALRERLKRDAGTEEQQALSAKAAGPAFRCRLLLLAVADEPAAGVAQVATIGAALAGSAQAVALSAQRLQAGPVQLLPAVVPPRPPCPRRQRWLGLISGVLLAAMLALLLRRSGLALTYPLAWAVVPLVFWLPLLTLAAAWRRRTDAELPLRHATLLAGVLPPRNPRVVPLWWPWLGRVE